jgi:glycerol-3-phosphate acyltransferase PlsY
MGAPGTHAALIQLAQFAAMGYLLGSIPFGVILTRLGGYGDLRRIGSGNIGATNALRTGNRWIALGTLIGDGGKGALAVLIARHWGFDTMVVTALGAFLGHLYPVWIGFRGGKGVATFLGLQLALSWPTGLICCAAWLLGAGLSRISSVGALAATLAGPLAYWYFDHERLFALCLILSALVWLRHRENIARILRGTEPRIGAGKAAAKPEATETDPL